jgi:hypothetical protein
MEVNPHLLAIPAFFKPSTIAALTFNADLNQLTGPFFMY